MNSVVQTLLSGFSARMSRAKHLPSRGEVVPLQDFLGRLSTSHGVGVPSGVLAPAGFLMASEILFLRLIEIFPPLVIAIFDDRLSEEVRCLTSASTPIRGSTFTTFRSMTIDDAQSEVTPKGCDIRESFD